MKEKQREANLAAMLDSTSYLMTLIDRDLVYREVNRAYLSARGLSRDQVIGHRVSELWSEDIMESPLVGSSLERAFRGEAVRYQAIFAVVPGQPRAMDVAIDPVRSPAGEITHVVVASRDRTEERELVEELEGARRALEEAELARANQLARLGAELGEPLERLLARLEALESERDAASWLDRLREARRTIPALLARVDELAAPAGAADARRPPGTFRLAPFLEELALDLGRTAIAHGLLLAADAAGDLPKELRCHPLRLRGLLRALLERAAERMSHGTLELKVRQRPGGELVFELAGAAAGGQAAPLPAELCRDAERLGGRLEATESEIGVRLVIPALAAPEPAARHDSPRVLAVDDNPVNLEVLREQLERRGLEVVLAASGEEALRQLGEESFDLALLDSRMPGLDGLAVARLLRQQEAAEGRPRLALVAFTANAGPGDREACLAAGMDDYLTKPLRPAELDRVLACWLPEPAEEAGVTLDAELLATLDDPNDGAFLAELVDLFLADCPPRLQALAAAAAAGQRAAADDAAHALKSSAANLGAVALAKLAQRVCDQARSGSADLEELSRGVAREYARAAAALRCVVAGRA